LLLKNGLFPQ